MFMNLFMTLAPALYLFDGVDGVTLRRDRHTKVVVIISVLEEAAILFVLTGFLCVGHGEEVVLADKPVAKAAELNNCRKE